MPRSPEEEARKRRAVVGCRRHVYDANGICMVCTQPRDVTPSPVLPLEREKELEEEITVLVKTSTKKLTELKKSPPVEEPLTHELVPALNQLIVELRDVADRLEKIEGTLDARHRRSVRLKEPEPAPPQALEEGTTP